MEGHENILTELALSNGAHPFSDFNTALQFFVSSSRSDIHRKKLTIAPFFNYLSSLFQNNVQDKSDSYKLICTILKIARNLCAGEITNQTSFIHDGGLEITASLAKKIILHGSCNPDLTPESLDVCQMILQLLGNVCLAGEEQLAAVWRTFFPEVFVGFAGIQNAKIYEPLCMVICTSCQDNQCRLKELCGNNGCPIIAGILRTSQTGTVGIEWAWLGLLTKICFVKPYFVQLFISLRAQEASSVRVEAGNDTFSSEQAHLLHLIANFATDQMEEFSLLVNSRECKPVLREFVTSVVEIVWKSERIINFRPENPLTLPTGLPAIDILGYSLNILRDMCACEDSPSFSVDIHQIQETGTFSVVDSLVSSGLIKLMIHLLQELGPPETVEKAMRQASLGSSSPSPKDVKLEGMAGGIHRETSANTLADTFGNSSLLHAGDKDWMSHVDQKRKVCPYKGYRRDIVSVLANATFRRKHVQDQIRECGALLLLLQQCVVDEKNPFLREWGLWAVRNLLEGNRENQQEVAELELQNYVNTPAITEIGLRVEIDPNSRKPKLVNLDS
ncbi:hypothetical protein KI387_011097 [Taxus chinensis]|uniref:Ataxin-10 domain-containing protein n=1 Tax=Taxus chinensis TaxID=29808 RepID=A0AA38KH91_TAXCH|nr:hypothetical protein KI387_011097 [Taxus chinensis]